MSPEETTSPIPSPDLDPRELTCPQSSRPNALRSASGSVRAMVRKFERNATPESPSPCYQAGQRKGRSVSTPACGPGDWVEVDGEKVIKGRNDLKEGGDEIEHLPKDKNLVSSHGCVTGTTEEESSEDTSNGECSSLYSQYSEADGTMDISSNEVPRPLEISRTSSFDSQGEPTNSHESQPSTPKFYPIQTPTTPRAVPSSTPSTHTPLLPAPLAALLATPHRSPSPLPLIPHNPAAAAF